MDTDMNGDSVNGLITDVGGGGSLNGETDNPDVVDKLDQTVIIKQDVMLSARNTQSPMTTSSFPLATVAVPAVNSLHVTSLNGGLSTENLFWGLSGPGGPQSSSDLAECLKADHISNLFNQSFNSTSALTSSPFILSNGGLQTSNQHGTGTTTTPTTTSTGGTSQPQGVTVRGPMVAGAMPVQQLLIPVSTGNGTQQLISIPLSLAAGAGSQIQLLSTPGGQLIATNFPPGGIPGQPLNLSLPSSAAATAAAAAAAGAMIVNCNNNNKNSSNNSNHNNNGAGCLTSNSRGLSAIALTSSVGKTSSQNGDQLISSGNLPVGATAINGGVATIPTVSRTRSLPPRISQPSGAPGGAPDPSVLSPSSAASSINAQLLSLSAALASRQQQQRQQQHQQQQQQKLTLINGGGTGAAGALSLTNRGLSGGSKTGGALGASSSSLSLSLNGGLKVSTGNSAGGGGTLVIPASVLQQLQLQQQLNGGGGGVNHSLGVATIGGVVPTNINQLLPNTISSAKAGTIVDGVNLDEIREFAKQFKIRRLSLGLTQTQVGQALCTTEGPSYSQSAICRFEKLDITPKSAQKIKPVLEKWMSEAEERYQNGLHNMAADFLGGSDSSKKRKRRTSFTPQALEILNEHFERNTHPSGADMTKLAETLSYNREVIRIWFCNKRQALKNTVRRLSTSKDGSMSATC